MNEPRLIMTVQQVDMHCTAAAGRRGEHYPIGIGTELGKGEGKTTLSLSSLGLASSVNDDCPCSTFLGNFGLAAAAAAANTNRGEKLSYPLLHSFLPPFLHSLRPSLGLTPPPSKR